MKASKYDHGQFDLYPLWHLKPVYVHREVAGLYARTSVQSKQAMQWHS